MQTDAIQSQVNQRLAGVSTAGEPGMKALRLHP